MFTEVEKSVFSTPLVCLGQNRGFPRQCHKKCRIFCYLALFPEKSQGFTSGLWAQKLLAPFCNFDWKNSAGGQAEVSEMKAPGQILARIFFRRAGDRPSQFCAFGLLGPFLVQNRTPINEKPPLSPTLGTEGVISDRDVITSSPRIRRREVTRLLPVSSSLFFVLLPQRHSLLA